MKLSKYTEFIEKDEKIRYVYNYFTGSMIQVEDKNIFNQLKKSHYDQCPEDFIKILAEEGFLIEDDFEEFNELKFSNLAAKFDSTSLGITLVNTFKCNFNCPYCYEKTDGLKTMSVKVADQLLSFIEAKIKSNNIKRIDFHVLGGEPLLETDILDYFFDAMKKLQKSYGLQISNSIISNCYLLDEHVDKIKSWFNASVQVSFDGHLESHDKLRKCEDEKGSYEKIFSNMVMATNQGVNIAARYNLSSDNYHDAYKFIDDLALLEKKPFVYFGHLRDYTSSSCMSGSCLSRPDFSEHDYELIEYCVKKSIPCSVLPGMYTNHCIADTVGGYVVDPFGDMFKCWHSVGQKSKKFGNIANPFEITNKENFYRYIVQDDFFHNEGCKNCKSLPHCMGSCPMEKSEYGRVNCHTFKFNSKKYVSLYGEQQQG